MSKKAIFAQTEQIHWVDVAARLRDKYGWEICYFVGGKKQAKRAAALFPETIFHTKDLARNNQGPDAGVRLPSAPLDKTLLSALSFHESIYLKMLDRNDVDGSLTYHRRIASYHFQVMFWKGVLEHFNPNVVVYRIAPHTGYDYVLYALCRVLGIATVMFERTSLPGFVYPVSSFEDGSPGIRDTYAQALEETSHQEISLMPETLTHLENLSKNFKKGMPYHLKFKLKNSKRSGDLGSALSIVSSYANDMLTALLKSEAGSAYRQQRYHEMRGRLKRKKLLAHYNRLAKKVDLSKPFIFVALQCEPERQTCPVGGVFGHQYLMVNLLSKLAPAGWKIYVKEHVSQFKDYQAAERSKTLDFYDRITALPNVELVPLSVTSFELMDNAKASATVSGSVGWESVVRGKPAFLFGHSWYRDCEGVFATHTVEACRNALQKIQTGYQVGRNDLLLFAKVVETCAVRGYIDKFYEKLNLLSPAGNVENLARAIDEFTTPQN
jgi:hypothetical protein